jgi:lipopolysaccharide export system protein LptC
MKRWRWLLAVAIIGLVVVAAYVAGTSQTGSSVAKPNEADAATYAYEAHDVVLRQMDGSGALQYEIEAASITQLPRELYCLLRIANHDRNDLTRRFARVPSVLG